MRINYLLLVLHVGMLACKENSTDNGAPGSQKSEPTEEPQNRPTEDEQSDPPHDQSNDDNNTTGNPGTLAVTMGTVTIDVTPISTQGAFLDQAVTANNQVNVTGSLAISTEGMNLNENLSFQPRFNLAEVIEYRTPTTTASSITSGSPTEMIIYVKSIELSTVSESNSSQMLSLKAKHISLFTGISDAQKLALEQLVNMPYQSQETFTTAIMAASGYSLQALSTIFEPIFEELLASDEATAVTLFEDPLGKPVRLNNGEVDLSSLISGNTATPQFDVQPGTYKKVRVKYAAKAQVKGCVKMRYRCMSGAHCSNASDADIPGSNGAGGAESLHLYCTRTSKSPYIDDTKNVDFENQDPQLMDFPLDSPTEGWPSSRDITLDYNLPAVTINAGDQIKLTLVVDLNRMLRYYNRGRQDQGVNPGAPTNKSYFFTTIFPQSTFVFVGDAGRIYGYEMLANVCGPNDKNPTTNTIFDRDSGNCGNGNSPSTQVAFWMTLITGANGAPLTMLMMPDDDNALTITKGSAVPDFARCPFDENPRWVRAGDAQKAELHYTLCDNNSKPLKPGPYGKIYNFPVDLEATLAAPASESLGSGNIPGVLIKSNQRQSSTHTDNWYEGTLTVKRRL